MSIDGNDGVSGTGMIGENEQDKKMQVCSPVPVFLLLCLPSSVHDSPVWP